MYHHKPHKMEMDVILLRVDSSIRLKWVNSLLHSVHQMNMTRRNPSFHIIILLHFINHKYNVTPNLVEVGLPFLPTALKDMFCFDWAMGNVYNKNKWKCFTFITGKLLV